MDAKIGVGSAMAVSTNATGLPSYGTGRNGPPLDSKREDIMRHKVARESSNALLRGQLRAGQHLLPIALAEALGAKLNMPAGTVRAAAGDPTINEGALA